MASVTNQVSPAIRATAVTPADNTPLALGPCRAVYIGQAGNVSLMLDNDTVAVTFVGCYAGQILPVTAMYVMATGTTATFILALY
jgi:hypothetical protein